MRGGRYRRRDSAGAVYSPSLMFFSRSTSCALIASHREFPLKIVGVATFVATRSNKGRWGRVEVSEGDIFELASILVPRAPWAVPWCFFVQIVERVSIVLCPVYDILVNTIRNKGRTGPHGAQDLHARV
jgi:hypothetical protein